MTTASTDPHRAAILGSPVAHSLSPALHRAGYHAAGLTGWSYERIDCDAGRLPDLVGAAGPEWVGFSVTMPGKAAAAAVADACSGRVEMLGVANTLWRGPRGWHAENTDVDGVLGALRAAGVSPRRVLVLGGGGTALSVVAALAELFRTGSGGAGSGGAGSGGAGSGGAGSGGAGAGSGGTELVLAGRRPASTAAALELAQTLGLRARTCELTVAGIAGVAREVDLVVSTVPAGVADHLASLVAPVPALLDAVYHPWPTPLAAAGGPSRVTVTGLDMLMHQAFRQFELFTCRPAPRQAMRAGLLAASGSGLPLPLGEAGEPSQTSESSEPTEPTQDSRHGG